jgi:hypothetical protein
VPSREAERVLTTPELNRALLARQLLLDRAELPPDRALAAVCGLQAQHAPSGYLGLWSRTAGFRRGDLTAALHGGAVVQGWVMRSTIHMVAAADYVPFTTAVRAARRAQWLRAEKQAAGLDTTALAAAVRRHLADGPLPQARLAALLTADSRGDETGEVPRQRSAEHQALVSSPRSGKIALAGAQLWVDLLRVPPAGTWDRPRATVFGLAEQVLPDAAPAPEDPAAEERARDLLVVRYLRAFGPASAGDAASFTGLPVAAVRAALARSDVRRFRDEAGGELVDVRDGPLPDAATPAPVRFLPTWDATLLVHARRTQVLPEAYRSRVFATTMPRSVPTFLVAGQVAGTWRYADGRVETTPFHELPAGARRALDAEAERLAAFHADGA